MNGHKKNGRFAEGNQCARKENGGNGGRKRREDEATIKTILIEAKPTADIVKRLAECVDKGEGWAISLWLAYLWGKPVERVEATGADGDALVIRIVRKDN